jgi:hypothetical protein
VNVPGRFAPATAAAHGEFSEKCSSLNSVIELVSGILIQPLYQKKYQNKSMEISKYLMAYYSAG